jgi:general secretion pathway protein D
MDRATVSRNRRFRPLQLATIAAAALLALSGCAGLQQYRQGTAQIQNGDLVGGVRKLQEAARMNPENVQYRNAYFTQRDLAVNRLLREGDLALSAEKFEQAKAAFESAKELDPSSPRALAGADRIEAARRLAAAVDAAEKEAGGATSTKALERVIEKVRGILAESPNHPRATQLYRRLSRQLADLSGRDLGVVPRLKPVFQKPTTLNFSNASLIQVFESLKLASGLNFVFDRDAATDRHVTMSISEKPLEEVLRVVMQSNQLQYRVVDEDTILLYPNTAQKIAEYRELVVRSFYLSHADLSKTATLLKSLVKIKDVQTDEKLNLIIVRDSAEAVKLAERIIANVDMADPEVTLELEVLEVTRNRLLQLGIQWPSSAAASVKGQAGNAGELLLSEFEHPTTGLVNLQFNDPLVSAQLLSQTSDSDLLANPRIRVRNRESAKVLIGQRVPVITTTSTANVGTSESISYLDVGLKLEVEPTVSLDEEVSMKVALEVSDILSTITLASGSRAYQLGTRNASTVLRVHDNETQILAGLIQRDRQRSNTGLPWLNEFPVLNRLFGQDNDTNDKTEVVLLITPHIVRSVEVPGPGQLEILSGTETALGGDGGSFARPSTTPAASSQPPVPARPLQPSPGASAGPNPTPQGITNNPVIVLPPSGQAGSSGSSNQAPAFTPPGMVPSSPNVITPAPTVTPVPTQPQTVVPPPGQ